MSIYAKNGFVLGIHIGKGFIIDEEAQKINVALDSEYFIIDEDGNITLSDDAAKALATALAISNIKDEDGNPITDEDIANAVQFANKLNGITDSEGNELDSNSKVLTTNNIDTDYLKIDNSGKVTISDDLKTLLNKVITEDSVETVTEAFDEEAYKVIKLEN